MAPDVRDYPVTIQISSEVNVQINYRADAFITAEEAQALLESMVAGATGGFVEMAQNIPPVARQDRTLYGEIGFDFTGTSPAQLGLEV